MKSINVILLGRKLKTVGWVAYLMLFFAIRLSALGLTWYELPGNYRPGYTMLSWQYGDGIEYYFMNSSEACAWNNPGNNFPDVLTIFGKIEFEFQGVSYSFRVPIAGGPYYDNQWKGDIDSFLSYEQEYYKKCGRYDPLGTSTWWGGATGSRVVVFEDGIQVIAGQFLAGNRNTQKIILPKTLHFIGSKAFGSCNTLQEVVFQSDVDIISDNIFQGCTNLSSVVGTEKLSRIGEDMFSGTRINYIQLSSRLVSMGKYAFAGSQIESLDIPAACSNIGSGVFHFCEKLKSVRWNESSVIPSATFVGCGQFHDFTIPNTVTQIGDSAFYGTAIRNVEISCSVDNLGGSAFQSCNQLTNVFVNCANIGPDAFNRCQLLEEVTIGNNVTNIGRNAFCECPSIRSVVFGTGLQRIDSDAFACCTKLKRVRIDGNSLDVGGYAFASCTNLARVEFSENVKSIGGYAFRRCNQVEFVFEGPPPSVFWTSFGDVHNCCGFYYPEYKSQWGAEIENGYWHGLKMVEKVRSYKITYEVNGGDGCANTQECEFGSGGVQVDDGGNLHWEGHCFVGWAFAPDGDVVYKAGDYVAEPTEGETVSLYAKWATLEPLSADWTSGAITLKATNVYGQQADRCWLAVCDANTTAAGDENGAWKPIDSVEFRGTWCDEYANCVVTDDKFATRLGGVPALKYRLQIGKSANEIRITVYSSVVRTKRGIFVGVGEYGVGYGSNKPSPRPFASGKTRQFHDLMVSDGKMNETDACLLTDSDATYEKVCEAFTNVGGKTKPGDVCVVYFSTHGGEISIGGKLSTVGSLYLYNYPPREADEHHVGYHEALLAKHLRMLDSEKKGVAVVCVISACHSGTFFYDSPEEDKLCNPFDSWCHKEDMSGLSIAWITSADAEHSSYASDSVDDMTRFLIDYGWVKGWGAKGESLTFYGLAHYAKGLYDALFDGLTFEGETGSLKMQIEDKSQMLSNIILCNAKSHDGTVLPPAKVVEARASTGEYPEEISTAWHVVDGARYYCVFAKSVNDAAACIIIHEAPSAKASFSVEKNPQMKNEILASSEIRPMRFVVKAVNEAGVSSSEEFSGWVKHADEDIELAYVYDHNLTYQFKGSAQSETLQLSVGKRGSVSAQGTMPNGERFAATTQAIVVNEDEIYIPILVNSKTGGTISLGVCISSSGAISIDEDAYWTNGDSRKSISLASDGRMVSFAANGGMGTMRPVQLASGRVFKLPKCTLKPPVDKTRFAGWACSNGKRYDDEMLVFGLGDVTMTAIWE